MHNKGGMLLTFIAAELILRWRKRWSYAIAQPLLRWMAWKSCRPIQSSRYQTIMGNFSNWGAIHKRCRQLQLQTDSAKKLLTWGRGKIRKISQRCLWMVPNKMDSNKRNLDLKSYLQPRIHIWMVPYILKDFKKSRNFVVTINNSKSLACDMLTFCNRCGTVVRVTSLEQLSLVEFSGE